MSEYCGKCSHCATNIHSQLRPAGLMERYAEVSEMAVAYHIDLLTGLAPSSCLNEYTAVLTVVDRF